ncbi:Hypothetical protein CAP_2926 [Chondromyces apiculatus DSM 436]|uniref:Rad50/SbcC-type AAA domain-containing protein n=1 Tax=Chondromyces apiculatus DSM 436 TaxID=1192034 RepID=A0A017TAL3_9BACT|nr:Hypothetical protein CAP_2926 [Chondromyces apiculatus DSM 436]
MLATWINLDGIKCFDNVEVDLRIGKDRPHKWVVVYGDNSLGKSTLLKAFGVALTGQPALNALMPSAQGWVREGSSCGVIGTMIQQGPDDRGPGRAEKTSRKRTKASTKKASSAGKVAKVPGPAVKVRKKGRPAREGENRS